MAYNDQPKSSTSGLSLSFFSPSGTTSFKVKTLVLPPTGKLDPKGKQRLNKIDNSN